MNRNSNILSYIISISFTICALLSTVHFCCFDKNFYNKEHDLLKIYNVPINEHIGISKDELRELTSFTLDYLNDKFDSLDLKMNIKGENREVFTNDEKAHMVDVKKLNLTVTNIAILSFFVFVIALVTYLIKKNSFFDLFVCYRKTLLIFLVLFSFIGIWILIDFDGFWTYFHHVFFSGNELWLLDLRSDILIMIVPPEFFYHLVTKIVIIFIAVIVMFGVILYYLNKRASLDD